jgi:hypothetical protein
MELVLKLFTTLIKRSLRLLIDVAELPTLDEPAWCRAGWVQSKADEADDRPRLTPRDTEEGFGVRALRRAPGVRSVSAVLGRTHGHRNESTT